MNKLLSFLLSCVLCLAILPVQAQDIQSQIKSKTIQGSTVYTLSKDKTYQYTILYLHGGAYVSPLNIQHWNYCDQLAQILDAQVILPEYPLAPESNWKDAYTLLESVYKKIPKKKPIILMGDSAGGGLAAGFCEYLSKKHLHRPQGLILFSPWLDISCSNPKIQNYIAKDTHLDVQSLQTIGKQWAHGLDPKDYHISPLYGPIEQLSHVYVFVGTEEIFYPDILQFYHRLKTKHVSVTLTIGQDMQHNYPLGLGYSDQADQAFHAVISYIKKR